MFETLCFCLVTFVLGILISPYIRTKTTNENESKKKAIETHKKTDGDEEKVIKPNKKLKYLEKEDIKMIFCVREDLKMGVGKISAQVAHAAVALYSEIWNGDDEYSQKCLEVWDDSGSKKIVVKVKDYEELKEIHKQCKSNKLTSYMIMDAGKTQVDPGTVTVLGIGPDVSEKINKITGKLKLM